jgi:DNA-binding SARP family transcriptional activator
LITSALGRLTGPLCDELLEQTGSAAVLEELETLQFFTTSTDAGATYRYHQVLQTHLEGLLIDELGATASREIRSRSANLLEKAGHLREAMRAYALADDWASVARLLQQGSSVAHDWVAQSGLPDDDPWLALARARRLFRSGSVDAAVAAYRDAEALLDDPEFQARCANERAQAEVWMPQAPALVLPVRRTGQAIRQALKRLPGLGPGVDARVGVDPIAVGTIALLGGRFDVARESLLPVAADSAVRPAGRLWAAIAVVVTDLALGNWSHAEVPLEEIALSAELDELPWLARLAGGLQAAVLLVTRPEDWRPDGCASIIDECSRDGDRWGSLLMAIFLGAAQLKAGNDKAAIEWLRRAATEAAGLDARVPQAWALALGAVAMARRRHPGTTAQLTAAESLIRSAAVPGAHRLIDHARQLAEPEKVVAGIPVVAAPIAKVAARLSTLGGFRLEIDGQVVQWPPLRPRARALLLLLAINSGKDMHRERLIDALWPDAPADAGTHRLQVAASNVRQCLNGVGLGDQAVQRNGEAYRLVLPEVSIDLTEFETQLRRARRSGTLADWSGALDLYVGELLPEVGAAEWVLAEREHYRLAAADAAVQVAGLAEDAHALRAAHRAVELDPLRDSSWLLLADLQAEQGDPTAAAATRREHARICAQLAAPVSPRERPGRDA